MKNNLLASIAVCAIFLFMACQKDALEDIDDNGRFHSNEITSEVLLKSGPTNDYYVVDSVGKNIQFFNEHYSADYEQNRLELRFRQTDFLPTGFFLDPNQTLTINVAQIKGNNIPKLLIGTYSKNGASFETQEVQLTIGNNTVKANSAGGLLWIRYGNTSKPTSSAKLTFLSGHKKAPTFIKNITSLNEFTKQISGASPTVTDALLIGQNTYIVLPRTFENISSQDNNILIENIDIVWKKQEELSGLDNSNNLHRPNKIPHLLTICDQPHAGGFALHYRTGYSYTSIFNTSYVPNLWFQRHELGHLHQLVWDWHAEIIGDFYAIATGINLKLPKKILARDGAWLTIWNRVQEYFNKPDTERDYAKIWGDGSVLGSRFLGAAMMIQLKYAFGDEFYHQLHKITRIEKPSLPSTQSKYVYFMVKACEISGYDLTNFFKKWGLNQAAAYATIASLNLPKPIVEPHLFTDDVRPTIQNGAVYKIVSSIDNSSVLNVSSHAPINNTPVSLSSSSAGNHQKFLVRLSGEGQYVFKSLADTNKVLDVQDGSIANGSQIIVSNHHGGNSQRWSIESTENGYINLKSALAANKSLDIYHESKENNTKIQLWTSSTNSLQKFRLERTD